MKTTRMGKDNCPICKKRLDTCSSPDNAIPEPGSITICYYCSAILIFSDDMALIKLSNKVFNSLSYEMRKKILKIQKVVIESKLISN